MNKQVILILEGSMGAGKTTMAKKLMEHIEKQEETYQYLREEIDKGILKKYYENFEEYCETLQTNIINQRTNQLLRIDKKVKYVIMDRSILSTRIFTMIQRKLKLISKEKKKEILNKTKNIKIENTIVLYLKSREEIEKERVKERNDNVQIPEEYLKGIYQNYEEMVKKTYRRYVKKENLPEKDSTEYQEEIEKIYLKMKNLSNQINQNFAIGVLHKKGKVYLSQRIKETKEYYKYYQVPGGRIEPHETPEEACKREVFEETGIDLKPEQIKYIATHRQVDNQKGKMCDIYAIELEETQIPITKEPQNNSKWEMNTLKEMYEKNLTPSLKRYKAKIIQEVNKNYKYLGSPDQGKKKKWQIKRRQTHLNQN